MDWYDVNWKYRIRVTVLHSAVDSTLTNFPVHVNLLGMPTPFHGRVQAGLADVRVTKADGITEVARDIVRHDAGYLEGEMYFLADTLSAIVDTHFYIYFGNAAASDYATTATYGRDATWVSYNVVHHFTEDPSTGANAMMDSTGGGNTGTAWSSAARTTYMASSKRVAGVNGGYALDFEGDQIVEIADAADIQLPAGDYTISMWLEPDVDAYYQAVFDKATAQSNREYGLWLRASSGSSQNWCTTGNTGGSGFTQPASPNAYVIGAWQYITFSVAGTTLTIQRNNYTLHSVARHGTGTVAATLQLGHYHTNEYQAEDFDGRMDEFRIRKGTASSAAWSRFDYETVLGNAILIGAIEGQWYDTAWPHRVQLIGYSLHPGITNFPIYVDLSNLPQTFHERVKADGSDIRVTEIDGVTELPREVVFYSSSAGEMHFKAVEELPTSSETCFYIYFGNADATEPSVSSTYGRNNVWSSYLSVYHLDEAVNTTAGGYKDATGNRDGTGVSTTLAAVDGALSGKAANFDGSADYISLGNSAAFQLTTGTISAWINTASAGGSFKGILSKQFAFGMFLETETLSFYDWSAGNNDSNQDPTDSTWRHVALTFQSGVGSGSKLYLDGSNVLTSVMTVLNQTVELQIGAANWPGQYFTGYIDEVRIASDVKTAEWVALEQYSLEYPDSFMPVNVVQSLWYHPDWSHRVKVTVHSELFPSTITDFPFYLNLADLPSAFHAIALASGADIRITTGDGVTEIPFELTHKTGAGGGIFAKLPRLGPYIFTELYVYFGNPVASAYAATHPYGSEQVWDAASKVVYHLEQVPPTVPSNSTSAVYTETYGSGIDSGNSVTGRPTGGNGLRFDATVDDYIDVADHANFDPGTGDFRVSMWAKLPSSRSQSQGGGLVSHRDSGSYVQWSVWHASSAGSGDVVKSNKVCLYLLQSLGSHQYGIHTTNDVADGNWHKIDFVRSSSVIYIYIDGFSVATTVGQSIGAGPACNPNNAAPFRIGYSTVNSNYSPDQSMDLIRWDLAARSAAWIESEYINQSDPSASYYVDAVESLDGSSVIPFLDIMMSLF